jgi:hypothetical protein
MVPEGNNSYRAHYFEDLYVLFDGAVIYDDDKKREIVEVIVQLMPEMTGPDADPATYYDFVTRRLIAPFLLFKRRQFAGEAEYRYVFVRKHDVDDSFECSRDIRGRRSSYVKVLISPRSAPTIIKKFDGH